MSKIKNREYGQAMVEFALTLPIFLLLVFGVIELSRFFLVYSSVFTASREATRYGSSVGDINNKNYLNCETIAERAVFSGNFGGVQLDDITISYESTPGNIVASCPNFNSDSVPIKVGCTGADCDYEPELGHRVLVDIVTDFDSLLGIVPNLPVRAVNGRTIMMEISIERTPKPFELCTDKVELVNLGEIKSSDDFTLYVEVKNKSLSTFFQIYQIKNINWTLSGEEPKLVEIIWDGVPIWIKDLDEEGRLPLITIPEGNDIEYWKEFNRNLNPDNTVKLEFVFKDVLPNNVNLEFELIMQHANIITDFCDPVE